MHLGRATLVLWVATTAVLAAADAVLLRRNLALQADIFPQLPLRAGTSVPPLIGLGLGGQDVSITYGDDAETLLLVVSPGCPFCEMDWPKWRTLLREVKPGVRVVVVGNNPNASLPSGYVADHLGPSAAVVARPDPGAFAAYHLFYAPQTLFIDSRGRVESCWPGVLTDAALRLLSQRVRARDRSGLPARAPAALGGMHRWGRPGTAARPGATRDATG